MKCSVNDGSLRTLRRLVLNLFRNHLNLNTDIELTVKDTIKEVSEQFELKDFDFLARYINDIAKTYGLATLNSLSVDNLREKLEAVGSGILLIDDLETSTLQVTDIKLIRSKRDASRLFLDVSFGLANEVTNEFCNIVNSNLFDILFVNRNFDGIEKGIVSSNLELNNNIRTYQNYLVQQIVTYLKSIYREATNNKLSKEYKDALNNPVLYDSSNKNTGILDVLKPLIEEHIIRPLNGQTDLLVKLYNDSKNVGADYNANLKKNAFYAVTLLNNFDTYLALLLGKSVLIKDFGLKTGEDKYQVARLTAKIATTWSISDNIDVEDKTNNIVKMSFETSPLYGWGEVVPRKGYYLKFGDFQHLIAKIKDLTLNGISDNVIFDDDFKYKFEELYNKLPKEVLGKSLSHLINIIRKNPRKYLHTIFDILSNDAFRQSYGNIYNNFTQSELDKLYSINKNIFNGQNSLRRLTNSNSLYDYYEYITESADSIFNVKFVQYYKDENGVMRVRTLLDQGINNIRRKIEQTIDIANSLQRIKDWDAYADKYKLRAIKDANQLLSIIEMQIPNLGNLVDVFLNTGEVRINGQINYADNFYKLLPFIDSVLKLNLLNNINFQNALLNIFKNKENLVKDLTHFALRVISNQYISHYLKESGLRPNETIEKANEIFGKMPPSFNYMLGELGLVRGNDIPILKNIALAKADMDGITSGTLVKDGEGNSQSNQTFSRLLGSFRSLWELQEKNSNSISKHFQLLINPNLLQGVFTVKEVFDSINQNKQSTKLSVNEMAYALLVYDFIGGLMPRNDGNLTGNGMIMIIPSVNSDKNTIGRLLINTNAIVRIGEKEKALRDCNELELLQLISLEFGQYYEGMLSTIHNDWALLESYLEQKYNINLQHTLSAGFKDNFNEFNLWFNTIETKYKTPVEFIKNELREFNKTRRLNPLELVDLVHYINKGGLLSFNETIISLVYKFKPDSNMLLNLSPDISDRLITSELFWKEKKAEVLISLLKAGFELNTISNLEELKYLRQKYKEWINLSGNMILAKVLINGKSVDITSKLDLVKNGLNADDINKFLSAYNSAITLNPLLEQYNYLQYFVSQEFINLNVGSFVAHPEKSGSSYIIELEAARFLALHKRNVSFTAAMNQFQLNTLTGIPEDYNIAVVEDVHDLQGTMTGLNNDIKPFDGATFVNPFVVILENNSLGGSKGGVTKKTFVHFKNEKTGTGGIIKTACFGITNDWIRNSRFILTMMQKMTDHKWLNEDGTDYIADITKDYNGNNINYKDFYFKRGSDFYKIVSIKHENNNFYTRNIQKVTEDGNPTGEIISEENIEVNSNYKLWLLFGGKNSMQLVNNKLELSNTSIENVVTAMNSIGVTKNNIVENQDDIYQPLKHTDVHYVVTAGAIKQGSANINSRKTYENNDIQYDIQKIHMYQAGVQLNKEHNADNEDLSLMTLVVSACASKGYTYELASELYEALRSITDINTKDHLDAVKELFTNGTEQSIENFDEVLMKSVIKSIGNSRSNSFAKNIALDLINQAKEGKKIKFSDANISLSDNTIFRRVFSAISAYLTNTGIKQHISGVLAVLTPTYGVDKIYAGRKLESFQNPKEELEKLQKQQKPVYNYEDSSTSITNLELGRTYIIEYNPVKISDGVVLDAPQTQSKLIRTPQEYLELKNLVRDGKIKSVTEDLTKGRDLASYNVRFEDINGNYYLMWDLDSYNTLFAVNELRTKWTKKSILTENDIEDLRTLISKTPFSNTFIPNVNNARQVINYFANRVRRWNLKDLMNLSPSLPNIIEQFNLFVRKQPKIATKESCLRFTRWVNAMLANGDGNKLIIENNVVEVTPENFNTVKAQVRNIFELQSNVLIDGQAKKVNKNTIKQFAYEVILPKTFATKFGLTEFDDLNEISNDLDWFIKQYVNHLLVIDNKQFDIALKRSKGDHIYVLTKDLLPKSKLTKLTGIITDTDEDGNVYRLDSNGNIIYQITPDTEIYKDSVGNEVIVSNDLNFYINNLDYDTVLLSDNFPESLLQDTIKNLRQSKNKEASYYAKYITSYGNSFDNIKKLSRQYHNVTLANYQSLPESNSIIKIGRKKHSSFLRALDTIAARIPALCLQSFMPLKTVAFENSDINTAKVSTIQFLLQGSDLDIDTASMATFDIDSNGMLQLWSPYSNITSTIFREASETLPFPTFKELTVDDKCNNKNNDKKTLSIFTKYGDLFNIEHEINKETGANTDKINIALNLNSPEKIIKFGKFLRETKTLYLPKEYSTFKNNLENAIGLTFDNGNQIKNLFYGIKNIIDKHNLYLNDINYNKFIRIINNYSMKLMYDIAMDPVNLQQSQMPVDSTTGPLKRIGNTSTETLEAKRRTPGNFVNIYESIDENMVGKDGIAICAVGLKGFLGLTLYNNYVLNNGTKEEQARLILGKDHRGITIGRNTYKLVANIRAKDPLTVTNDDVLECLASVTNDHDAVLVISALLSLSTDNAKELCLSKLNATTKTIGMYLYGITIGMDFRDISSLLMSRTGLTISSLMNGNIFTRKSEMSDATKVFNYFDYFPNEILSKYNKTRSINKNKIANPVDVLKRLLANLGYPKNADSTTVNAMITDFAKENWTLQQKLKYLDDFRSAYNVSSEGKELYNNLIDLIEKYVFNLSEIDVYLLEDLKTLALGAQEMRLLGSMLSSNLGIKTDIESMLNQVNKIERCIYDKTKDENDVISLTRFVFDDKYRQLAIDKYELVKHSFNVLDVISKVPNYMGYIQTLAVALEEVNSSFKVRNIRNMTLRAKNNTKVFDEKRIIKGIENYTGDWLRKEWFIETNANILIPNGNMAIDENGHIVKLNQATEMYLGDDWGAASFKMFMEQQVIPDLQNGHIKPGIENSSIKNNKFIKDLINDIRTNTISGNPILVYTLPANMLPRTEIEKQILNQYKAEFNKLSLYTYEYEYNVFDKDGEPIKQTMQYNLLDLFTYYAMIAHDWKLSENSLVPMLENFQNKGMLKDFLEFEKRMDKSRESLPYTDDLIPYIAPKGSPYYSNNKYIWATNPDTHKYLLMLKSEQPSYQSDYDYDMYDDIMEYSDDEYRPISVNGYEFTPDSEDTLFFKTGKITKNINEAIGSINIGSTDTGNKIIDYKIGYDKTSGKVRWLTVNNNLNNADTLKLGKIKEIPFEIKDGKKQIRKDLLEILIESLLTEC